MTHIFSNDGIACLDVFACFLKDALKIGVVATESSRAEEEYFLVVQLFQQLKRSGVGYAFVCPESDVEHF